MFDTKPVLEDMIKRLRIQHGLEKWQASVLCRVEIGLYLLERLDLLDEYVTALWAVLTGLPLPRLKEKNGRA